MELVLARLLSDNVSVLMGVGDGTFGAAVQYTAGDGPFPVVIADLDGDELPDLVLCQPSNDG